MAFVNGPLKTIQVTLDSSIGVKSLPWYNPTGFPIGPADPTPHPTSKDFRWKVTLSVTPQIHSYHLSRTPGTYNGQDISVGLWIANMTTGQSWQITEIESKTEQTVTAYVQDVYRYNTLRDSTGTGNGGPNVGSYVVFDLGTTGIPEIDPVPHGGVSAGFTQNLQSKFAYINLQFDYPLYQKNNTFKVGDVIAADSATNSFVKADGAHRISIGTVNSVSETTSGWFTITPVQKIVDFLDYLPGRIGDTVYTSLNVANSVTSDPDGAPTYIKLRDHTSTTSTSLVLDGSTKPGNVFELNKLDVTVAGTGSLSDVVSAVNSHSAVTGVSAKVINTYTKVATVMHSVALRYGEPLLWAQTSPASASINGIPVVFDIVSTDASYEGYARSQQMADAINNALIPGVTAYVYGNSIQLVNKDGGPIDIVNSSGDINGVMFAGAGSGSGIQLSTLATSTKQILFTAVDARPIEFTSVHGTPTYDLGLVSVENGTKACGLFIANGVRYAKSTVVPLLSQLSTLRPLIGDMAYVVDSDDGNGNDKGEWSLWLYSGTVWSKVSNQDSASTASKSIEYTLTPSDGLNLILGPSINTGVRVTRITIEVEVAFDVNSTISVGYRTLDPSDTLYVTDGLMPPEASDLSVVGTYTSNADILFGSDTPAGDVEITGVFNNTGATGRAKVVVYYN